MISDIIMQNRINSNYQGRRMIMICLVFIICHLSFCPVGAQSYTQRVQQNGGMPGKVTIHQDAAIDNLVNGVMTVVQQVPKQEKPAQRQQNTQRQQNNATAQRQPTQSQSQPQTQSQSQSHSQSQTPAEVEVPAKTESKVTETETELTPDTLLTDPKRMKKIVGYRIQAFVGGKTRADRQKAERTGEELRTIFPGHQVYVHFYSPRWICRMGNFRTLTEAKEVLDEVVKMGYDTATIVRGKITVPY